MNDQEEFEKWCRSQKIEFSEWSARASYRIVWDECAKIKNERIRELEEVVQNIWNESPFCTTLYFLSTDFPYQKTKTFSGWSNFKTPAILSVIFFAFENIF